MSTMSEVVLKTPYHTSKFWLLTYYIFIVLTYLSMTTKTVIIAYYYVFSMTFADGTADWSCYEHTSGFISKETQLEFHSNINSSDLKVEIRCCSGKTLTCRYMILLWSSGALIFSFQKNLNVFSMFSHKYLIL